MFGVDAAAVQHTILDLLRHICIVLVCTELHSSYALSYSSTDGVCRYSSMDGVLVGLQAAGHAQQNAQVCSSTCRSSPALCCLLLCCCYCREVGGQMQPIWHHYYEEPAAVLFVVDAAQPSRLADSAMLLFDLLQDPQLQVGSTCDDAAVEASSRCSGHDSSRPCDLSDAVARFTLQCCSTRGQQPGSCQHTGLRHPACSFTPTRCNFAMQAMCQVVSDSGLSSLSSRYSKHNFKHGSNSSSSQPLTPTRRDIDICCCSHPCRTSRCVCCSTSETSRMHLPSRSLTRCCGCMTCGCHTPGDCRCVPAAQQQQHQRHLPIVIAEPG